MSTNKPIRRVANGSCELGHYGSLSVVEVTREVARVASNSLGIGKYLLFWECDHLNLLATPRQANE